MLGLAGSSSRNRRRNSSNAIVRRLIGGAPANNSYKMTPSEYTSVRVSTSSPDDLACSGLDVFRGSDDRPQPGENGIGGQLLAQRFGDSEIDDLWRRPAIDFGNQNIGRLQVAVEDGFLVGVLDPFADVHE